MRVKKKVCGRSSVRALKCAGEKKSVRAFKCAGEKKVCGRLRQLCAGVQVCGREIN